MFMIVTALYCEAKPFILHYHLKKDNTINKFQVFRNEEILLIITNTGSIAAAVGVAFLCNLHSPGPDDFLINVGVCAAGAGSIEEGSLFLCNKITEKETGRCFYPDILFRHPFEESDIMTCNTVIQNNGQNLANEQQTRLFDMEAAGIYQAGAYYFQPHQMIFLKIVSDHCEKKVSPDEITSLVGENSAEITAWLDQIRQTKFPDHKVLSKDEEAYIIRLADDMQCSVTMKYKLRQLLVYYKLVHGSFMEITDSLLQEKLPFKTKTEGKMYFEQLKAKLI